MIYNIPNPIVSVDLSATITTTWSSNAQTISVSGILSTDTPIIGVDLSSVSSSDVDSVLKAWAEIYRITTADGSITVYCDDETSIAIPIIIKVIR